MSQSEISDFLQKHKYKWFSVRDVSKATGLSYNVCDDNLRCMRKHNEVFYKRANRQVNKNSNRPVALHKFKRVI